MTHSWQWTSIGYKNRKGTEHARTSEPVLQRAFVGKYLFSNGKTYYKLSQYNSIYFFQRKHSPTATGIQSKWIADGIEGGGADWKWTIGCVTFSPFINTSCCRVLLPFRPWRQRWNEEQKWISSFSDWYLFYLPTDEGTSSATNQEVIRLNKANKWCKEGTKSAATAWRGRRGNNGDLLTR